MVDAYLSIEDLKKVEMVVGLVVAAKNAENSEKLIRLELDLGVCMQYLAFGLDQVSGRKNRKKRQ
jgi:tRNA-binding EMAP/Myf-like protein